MRNFRRHKQNISGIQFPYIILSRHELRPAGFRKVQLPEQMGMHRQFQRIRMTMILPVFQGKTDYSVSHSRFHNAHLLNDSSASWHPMHCRFTPGFHKIAHVLEDCQYHFAWIRIISADLPDGVL